MLRHANLCLILTIVLLSLSACASENYTPKPRAYPKMDLPEKVYQHYPNDGCPFVFDIPVYASVDKNPTLIQKDENRDCWMDIVFKDFNARFHISYLEIDNDTKLTDLIEDAHKLTSKHIKKAEYIDQRQIITDKQVYGLFSDVGGNAASSMQFYLTDSTSHYLFGSLYFSTVPNYDSIQPAIQFIKADMLRLIDSFEWQDGSNPTASLLE